MLCPLCRDTSLEPRFSRGIEVDVCPRCRGLWLDRGELERLLAEADVPGERSPSPGPMPAPAPPRERTDEWYDDRTPGRRKKSKAKRLADLFEDVLDL
jgi:Zn-finger nucleic acid-binding protein